MSDPNERACDADRQLVARIAEAYRPRDLAPAERSRFDAALRERVTRAQRSYLPVVGLAAGAAALALAVALWPGAAPLAPDSGRSAETAAVREGSWETELWLAGADASLSEEAYLPDEYVAITLAFMDGP